jgi:Niemann-Pick C1 protein
MDNLDMQEINQQIDALEDQRKVTKAQQINQGCKDWAFFTFSSLYIRWDLYIVTVKEMITTTVIGVIAVTVVAFLLIPHILAALFVLPLICGVYIDVLGVLQWSGAYVNTICYFVMVMSIAFWRTTSCTCCFATTSRQDTARKRQSRCFAPWALRFSLAALRRSSGIMMLALSTSEVFRTIFFAFLGVVTLGCGHGLILLPLILSIIGPEDQAKTEATDKRSQSDEECVSSDNQSGDGPDDHTPPLSAASDTVFSRPILVTKEFRY